VTFLKGSGWGKRLWYIVQGENDDEMLIRDARGGFIRLEASQAAELLPRLAEFASENGYPLPVEEQRTEDEARSRWNADHPDPMFRREVTESRIEEEPCGHSQPARSTGMRSAVPPDPREYSNQQVFELVYTRCRSCSEEIFRSDPRCVWRASISPYSAACPDAPVADGGGHYPVEPQEG